jgi:Spy/CpxP family protein refolding chaperone
MKRIGVLMLGVLWFCAGASASAQSAPGNDPVAAALIAPDVVMAHQDALALSDAQRKAIQADAQSAQVRFSSLQWQLSAATEKLVTHLNATHVDQDRALAALDAVLALERELKHTQLTLMIQIKNQLSAEQQARARAFATGAPK